jgi:hypothetical protein
MLMELDFLDRFFKNFQTLKLIKISPVGAEMFHADRPTDGHKQTDVTKLIVAFRNFAKLS